MKSQKDAVFSAVTSVLKENSISFEAGQNATPLLTEELRGQVSNIIFQSFKKGAVVFEDTASNREKMSSDGKLRAYVSGLISNYLRKDVRLNGNTKYVAKNPGSRAGATDEQLKTLRALRKKYAGTDKEAAINTAIDARVAEVRASKVKNVEVSEEQLAALPEELRAALSI